MPTNTKHLRYQLTCLTMRYLTTAMQYLFGIMFDIAPILTNQNSVIKARVDGRAVPVWKCVNLKNTRRDQGEPEQRWENCGSSRVAGRLKRLVKVVIALVRQRMLATVRRRLAGIVGVVYGVNRLVQTLILGTRHGVVGKAEAFGVFDRWHTFDVVDHIVHNVHLASSNG
ncbi:hypothetical protein T03_6041 [Trichinella britovi]|uniref:Uncharacterized protein n=1 Tax=Trichinella britovi TaxID=45882 RepID=A0A0V1D6J1_TRIBR|nr:hypothetical protein T09_1168 [Trichinella sp. T9]KRY57164.1 hypothetical protein T03_6041 [Trichinella britovi]